jgi:hypothetical protein
MPDHRPTATPTKSVLRIGRRVAGLGNRGQAPAPLIHSAPHNAGAAENAATLAAKTPKKEEN